MHQLYLLTVFSFIVMIAIVIVMIVKKEMIPFIKKNSPNRGSGIISFSLKMVFGVILLSLMILLANSLRPRYQDFVLQVDNLKLTIGKTTVKDLIDKGFQVYINKEDLGPYYYYDAGSEKFAESYQLYNINTPFTVAVQDENHRNTDLPYALVKDNIVYGYFEVYAGKKGQELFECRIVAYRYDFEKAEYHYGKEIPTIVWKGENIHSLTFDKAKQLIPPCKRAGSLKDCSTYLMPSEGHCFYSKRSPVGFFSWEKTYFLHMQFDKDDLSRIKQFDINVILKR